VTRFRSTRHPGDAPLPLVAARAQVRPVGLAFAAVMVVTTATVLQGLPVLRAFLVLTPLAYALAVAWTLYDLRRTPAEVVLGSGIGAVRSVWDVARTRGWDAPEPLAPVFHPRKADGALLVGFGDEVVTFRPDEWPQFDALRAALEDAADTADATRFTFGDGAPPPAAAPYPNVS
jgi:hypothetical protein